MNTTAQFGLFSDWTIPSDVHAADPNMYVQHLNMHMSNEYAGAHPCR